MSRTKKFFLLACSRVVLMVALTMLELCCDGSGDAMLACNSAKQNRPQNPQLFTSNRHRARKYINGESTSLNCHMLCGKINIVQSPDMYGVIFTIIIIDSIETKNQNAKPLAPLPLYCRHSRMDDNTHRSNKQLEKTLRKLLYNTSCTPHVYQNQKQTK